MKRTDKKDFLHTIALHLDLFNTIGGGVSETNAYIRKRKHEAVIKVWAAGIKPETFKIVLRKNRLTVSAAMYSEHNPNVMAPMYSRTFVLPPEVNLALIDATYHDGKLFVTLPYHEPAAKPMEIDIKQL